MKRPLKILLTLLLLLALSSAPAAAQRVVTVDNARDLADSMKSDTHIKLKGGEYVLGAAHVSYDFVVQGARNLTIEGESGAKIVATDKQEVVLFFKRCENIKLTGLTFVPKRADNKGTALAFEDCVGVDVQNISIAKGFGTTLKLLSTRKVRVANSRLLGCTERLLTMRSLSKAAFMNTKFIHSGWHAPLDFGGKNESITFSECQFRLEGDHVCRRFFDCDMDYEQKNCMFERCDFRDYRPDEVELAMKYESHMELIEPKFGGQ